MFVTLGLGVVMSKRNDDFFAHKSDWAVLKDDLLGYYLMPYLQKILATNRPLLYIDGFAGKGIFDDGTSGSPVIACECIKKALSNTHTHNNRISALLVEKKYDEELRENVKQYRFAQAIKGSYEELIKTMLEINSPNLNIFMYVDPYGVKSLDQSFFLRLPNQFSSIEVLINFNSFGFFRAACSVYGVRFKEAEDMGDFVVERDSGYNDSASISERKLTQAMGGEHWKTVVQDYIKERIDGYEAEAIIAEDYCSQLRSAFAYVQNLPIRVKESNHPKYRMVHASNHEQGCLLMYDCMQKRLVDMKQLQTGGQLSLFESDDAGHIVNEDNVRASLLAHISNYEDYVLLERVMADFVVDNGLTLSWKDLKKLTRDLEKACQIDVIRCPAYTEKTGKPTTFMESKRGRWVKVKGRDDEMR